MNRSKRVWMGAALLSAFALVALASSAPGVSLPAGGGRAPSQAQTAASPTASPQPGHSAPRSQNDMMGGGMMAGASGRGMTGGMMSGGMAGMDMGQMMGSAMADAAGDRVSQAQADTLGSAVPAGASVDRANNRITFQTQDVRLAILASPDNGPDMTFRIAGLADPTIVVPTGARVTLQFIQADKDTSHGWLLTSSQPPFSAMPMMDAPEAFAGSFAMPLGDPTDAGLHSETISFTAATAGQYSYLCPVMGHAQQGMHGTLTVQ